MADPFTTRRGDLGLPATKAAAVTPHDSNEIDVPQALYVGIGGTLVVRFLGDTANVTFSGVPSGSILPFRVKLVASTGTTASGIVALY